MYYGYWHYYLIIIKTVLFMLFITITVIIIFDIAIVIVKWGQQERRYTLTPSAHGVRSMVVGMRSR